VAAALVPASSVTVVAMKSLGSALAQPARVIGFSSGEEKITDSSTASAVTATRAMTNSFTRS
jgi:hypothetical protein